MPKILLIDDNKDITEMLSKYLKIKGFECKETNDGHNGYSLIKNEEFDYIFLDMAMPDFSGEMIIDKLKEENILKDKKIIIFTASSITNEKINNLLKNNGVFGIIKKPMQLQEILNMVSK